MVKIRLMRTGANRDISFRVVATDIHSPRDGQYLECLGWYDPKKKGINFKLEMERLAYWRKQGAQISIPVDSLLKRAARAARAEAAQAAAAVVPEAAQPVAP